jgi:hypothetical protein
MCPTGKLSVDFILYEEVAQKEAEAVANSLSISTLRLNDILRGRGPNAFITLFHELPYGTSDLQWKIKSQLTRDSGEC